MQFLQRRLWSLPGGLDLGETRSGRLRLPELVASALFGSCNNTGDQLERITSELPGKLIVQVDDVLPKHNNREVVGRGIRLHRWNLLAKNKVDV